MENDLNKASLGVWNEYLVDEKNRKITDRILQLQSFFKLNKEEEHELNILLKQEKEFLIQSEKLNELNVNCIKKIDFYKEKIQKDDRLITLFIEKLNNELTKDTLLTENVVSETFHNLMEKDIDVQGHDELNEEFKNIQKEFESEFENNEFIDTDCPYCTPVSEEEYQIAYTDCKQSGYFDKSQPEEERIMELMVLVHRLENKLALYENIEFLDEDLEDE